jgi:hypothetical protein
MVKKRILQTEQICVETGEPIPRLGELNQGFVSLVHSTAILTKTKICVKLILLYRRAYFTTSILSDIIPLRFFQQKPMHFQGFFLQRSCFNTILFKRPIFSEVFRIARSLILREEVEWQPAPLQPPM